MQQTKRKCPHAWGRKVARIACAGVVAGAILVSFEEAQTASTSLAADTFTNTAQPALSFGTVTYLQVNTSSRGWLRFDLSSLPAGIASADIAKATLTLWVNRVLAAGSFDVVPVLAPWTEDSLSHAGAPAVGPPVGAPTPVTESAAYVTVDVTAYVQDWVGGLPNEGLALVATAGTWVLFDSKENVATSHPATLNVTLRGPAGPEGPQGPQGLQGPQGIQGEQGPPGPAGTGAGEGCTVVPGPHGSAMISCPDGSSTTLLATLGDTFACAASDLWRPVECTTGDWVWSSKRSTATDLLDAAGQRVLYSGEGHTGDNDDGLCSLDGTGWVSTHVFTMSGCNANWYHLGGRFSGNCSAHDGDQVRRLVLTPNGCYDYRSIPTNGQGVP